MADLWLHHINGTKVTAVSNSLQDHANTMAHVVDCVLAIHSGAISSIGQIYRIF